MPLVRKGLPAPPCRRTQRHVAMLHLPKPQRRISVSIYTRVHSYSRTAATFTYHTPSHTAGTPFHNVNLNLSYRNALVNLS
eukprot:6204729-Pleurochrysis_carterae.AAC.5